MGVKEYFFKTGGLRVLVLTEEFLKERPDDALSVELRTLAKNIAETLSTYSPENVQKFKELIARHKQIIDQCTPADAGQPVPFKWMN